MNEARGDLARGNATVNGKFKLAQLPRDELLSIRARTSTAATAQPVTVKPSEVDGPVELVISERGACWIRGQVVDELRRPVPMATVSLLERRQSPESATGLSTYSQAMIDLPLDEEGRFESDALWPGVDYQLRVSSAGYADLEGKVVRGEPGKVYDFGQMVLEHFLLVTGEVVDRLGKPVPDAELRVVLPAGSPGASGGAEDMKTDGSGWFVLPRVKNGGTVRIWARKGGATSNGAQTFADAQLQSKLRIEIAEENACRLVGRVVDLQGEPVRSAKVAVVWEADVEGTQRPWQHSYAERSRDRRARGGPVPDYAVGEVETGDDGTFALDGLWPGEHYQLAISAPAHETVELPAILAANGGATVEPVVLRRGGLAIEGTVVDSAGRPVPAATVVNSGDAPRPLSVPTDAQGRFRIEGPVYALIRKDGFWPAGLRAQAGQTGLEVTLIGADQPRPDTRSAIPSDESPTAEEQAIARRLLTELWELREQVVGGAAWRRNRRGLATGPVDVAVARLMARVDPNTAIAWSAGKAQRFDEQVRREIARFQQGDENEQTAAAGNVPEVNKLLAKAKRWAADGNRVEAVQSLEAALRLVQQSETADVELQGTIVWRAQIGAVAIVGGQDEWGRRLLEEAAERVEKLAGDGLQLATRGEVAISLARIDPARAVRIWEASPSPPQAERSNAAWYAARLAVVLGASDVVAARRVAASQHYLQADALLVEVACKMAGTEPEKAVEIIEPLSNEWQQINALGRLAVPAAKRRPMLAYKLIDQALAQCDPSEPRGRSTVNRSTIAARLALAAAEIGYPDVRSAVDRTLAVRFTADERVSAASRAETAIQTARLLALVDPGVARDLLSVVPRPADALDTAAGDQTLGEWLEAWALVDAPRAKRLFQEILAEQRPRLTADCLQTCLLPMLDLLTTPPSQRAQLLTADERFQAFPVDLPDD